MADWYFKARREAAIRTRGQRLTHEQAILRTEDRLYLRFQKELRRIVGEFREGLWEIEKKSEAERYVLAV